MAFKRFENKNRVEWLKSRGRGIGGSDVGIIMGYSNFKNNVDLWKEKITPLTDEQLETKENSDEENNDFIKYGKCAEEHIRELFKLKYGNELNIYHNDNETLVRDDKPFMRASLDGEIEVLEDLVFECSDKTQLYLSKDMKGVLEIKTNFMPKTEWKDSIPMKYYCQTLHYLNVTSYDFVIVVAELNYRTYALTKYFGFMAKDKLDDMRLVESEVDNFWKFVETKTQPPTRIAF